MKPINASDAAWIANGKCYWQTRLCKSPGRVEFAMWAAAALKLSFLLEVRPRGGVGSAIIVDVSLAGTIGNLCHANRSLTLWLTVRRLLFHDLFNSILFAVRPGWDLDSAERAFWTGWRIYEEDLLAFQQLDISRDYETAIIYDYARLYIFWWKASAC